MRWQGMVEDLKTQEQDRAIHELSFLERLSLLVDQQWNWRERQVLERGLKAAKLKPACVEDIDHVPEEQNETGSIDPESAPSDGSGGIAAYVSGIFYQVLRYVCMDQQPAERCRCQTQVHRGQV
jgi:IstB-like ATP binding protein